MWTGPLHDGKRMEGLAAEWGWCGHAFDPILSTGVKMSGHNCPRPLEAQLALLRAESEPALPPWFLPMGHIARWLRLGAMPPRDALVEALRIDGHAASRSHAEVCNQPVPDHVFSLTASCLSWGCANADLACLVARHSSAHASSQCSLMLEAMLGGMRGGVPGDRAPVQCFSHRPPRPQACRRYP
jgi:hypothetical protein